MRRVREQKMSKSTEIRWAMPDFASMQTKCHFPIHTKVSVSMIHSFIKLSSVRCF